MPLFGANFIIKYTKKTKKNPKKLVLYQHHHFKNPRTTMMPLSLNFSCFVNRAASSGAHGSICRKYLGGTEKESCFFLPLSSQKSRGKNQPLFVSPLPSSNKNGPLFFTHLDGRGAVLCLSRGSGERRLRPLGSEEAEETTVPTSCALSFFTVSLSFRTVCLSFRTVSLSTLSPSVQFLSRVLSLLDDLVLLGVCWWC